MKSLEQIKKNIVNRLKNINENDENYEDKRWLIEKTKEHLDKVQELIEAYKKIPTCIYKEAKLETTFEHTDYLLILHVYENEKQVKMQKLLNYDTMTSTLYSQNVDALYDHCEEVIKEYIQSNYNQIYTIEL